MDENINSPLIAGDLNRLPDWRVEIHRNHLDPATGDRVVANYCAGRRWNLVTVDDMRYDDDTTLAIYRGDVHVFKLVTTKQTHRLKMLAALVIAKDEMLRLAQQHQGAFIAHIHKSGTVNVTTTFDDYKDIPRLTDVQRRTILKYPRMVWDDDKALLSKVAERR